MEVGVGKEIKLKNLLILQALDQLASGRHELTLPSRSYSQVERVLNKGIWLHIQAEGQDC